MLIHSKLAKELGLEARVSKLIVNLEDRLGSEIITEASEVRELSSHLFPVGFRLNSELSDRFRLLVSFSQCGVVDPKKITSHRPWIGPLIVAVKRLLWPFFAAQLKDLLIGQAEFNAQVVEELAHQAVRSEVT